jgi:hypothetical protein
VPLQNSYFDHYNKYREKNEVLGDSIELMGRKAAARDNAMNKARDRITKSL